MTSPKALAVDKTLTPEDSECALVAMFDALMPEVDAIAKWATSRRLDVISRRVLVRMVGAFIDAICSRMKSYALAVHDSGLCEFTDKQCLQLRDRKQIDGVESISYMKAAQNVTFAFKVYAHAQGTHDKVDERAAGWKALGDFVATRNRVTHPKLAEDLEVSRAETREALAVLRWFTDDFHRFTGIDAGNDQL